MYELIILSLLMRGRTHGYVIGGVINDIVGPFARASNGRLYPLLTELEEAGLVSVHEETTSEGGRVSRAFSITEPGRERFRRLMADTSSGPREYRDLFALKVTAFDQIPRGDRLRILEHYIEFARSHVRHLEDQASDIDQASTYRHSSAHRTRFANVFRHLVGVWQREAEWASEMRRDEAVGEGRAAKPRKKSKRG